MCNNIGLYIIHNHPFIYKASPSEADLRTYIFLSNELQRIEEEVTKFERKFQLTLIDFAIVTVFDYWSAKQAE